MNLNETRTIFVKPIQQLSFDLNADLVPFLSAFARARPNNSMLIPNFSFFSSFEFVCTDGVTKYSMLLIHKKNCCSTHKHTHNISTMLIFHSQHNTTQRIDDEPTFPHFNNSKQAIKEDTDRREKKITFTFEISYSSCVSYIFPLSTHTHAHRPGSVTNAYLCMRVHIQVESLSDLRYS